MYLLNRNKQKYSNRLPGDGLTMAKSIKRADAHSREIACRQAILKGVI